MATLNSFEEVEAWKKARELTRAIYRASGTGRFARDFALRDEVRRTAISVMSNIAEGFERGTTTEFLLFLRYSKGSAGELKAQLYVALDEGYVTPAEFARMGRLIEDTKGLIGGFSRYLREYRAQRARPNM